MAAQRPTDGRGTADPPSCARFASLWRGLPRKWQVEGNQAADALHGPVSLIDAKLPCTESANAMRGRYVIPAMWVLTIIAAVLYGFMLRDIVREVRGE